MNKKQISETIGIDQNTLKNWERSRPVLYNIVMDHFRSDPMKYISTNNQTYQANRVQHRQELSERIGVCEKTIYNWEREKPELINLINRGLLLEQNKDPISELLSKLPTWKQRKYYHLIMADIEEELKDD